MKKKNAFFAGLVLMAAFSNCSFAQSVHARIIGSVQDEQDGAYLSGVTIVAINTKTNAGVTVISEKRDGAFRFLALAPGIYQVSFELDGYHPYVASGIQLSAEQSFLLRVHLTRNEFYGQRKTNGAEAEENNPRTGGIHATPGRISIHVNAGCSYMSVGDSYDFLDRFGDRFRYVGKYFDSPRTGKDLSVEVGYRIMPRVEVAVGLGRIQAGSSGNVFIGSNSYSDPFTEKEKYEVDLNITSLPLHLVCRYWLTTGAGFLVSFHGGVLFNHSSWSMKTVHSQSTSAGDGEFSVLSEEIAEASGKGLGLLLGGRGELKICKQMFFTVDFSGRYAPLGDLSGRSEHYSSVSGTTRVTEGKLWSYECYDAHLGKWLWELKMGDRPDGTAVRNIRSAGVDHSGFSLKAGLLFRFCK